MILLLQSCPSMSVFFDAIALNFFRILKFLVLSLTITIFPYLFIFRKKNPRQLALFEFQENVLCFINSIVLGVREHMHLS